MEKSICKQCEYGCGKWKVLTTFKNNKITFVFYRANINFPCFEMSAKEIADVGIGPVGNDVDMWINKNIEVNKLKELCPYYCEHLLYTVYK